MFARIHPVNANPRRCLSAILLLVCLPAATSHAQYVEDSIDVGGAWVSSLAYNSREDVIYGTSESGWFFAISCDSNRVVSQFPLYGALSVCYDSLDNKAFCTYHDWAWNDSLLVVDGSTHSRVTAISTPGATITIWDPVLDRVYVSCQNSARVAVVDCTTDSLLAYIPVGQCPIKIYINTLRRKLYVLNSDEGSVSVVDIATNQVTKTVDVSGVPNAGYYCRSADKFYCGGDGEVVVLDGHGDSVSARIRVARYYDIFAVSGNDERGVVVASAADVDSRLYAIDVSTNAVDTFIRIAGCADAIHYSRASDRFYCTSDHSGEVVVLSGDGRQLLLSLPVAVYPYVIAESPVQGRLYVGHSNSSKVYVIRDATTAWPEGQYRESPADTALALRLDPSPFHDQLSIAGGISVPSGEVRVFAEDGRLVRSLNAAKSAGAVLRLTWDGRDRRGRFVPPGVYVVTAGGGVRAKAVKLR
jgi:YVTN family beta-propeller protein